jgi:hypothetical protein
MNQPDDHPLFVHVHIHKCAGTAFNDLIRRSFAPGHLDAYIADPFPTHRPENLADIVRRWPRVRSIASHSIRLYPPRIVNRAPLYVCFLRQPVDWFISYLTYVRKHYADLGEQHQRHLPPNADQLPLEQLAALVVEQFSARPTVYCTFVRYLAETTFRHALEPLIDLPPLDQPLEGPAAALFDQNALAMAKRTLEGFFFVGLVERMDESVQRLRSRLATVGLPLLDAPVERLNVTRQDRDDLLWASPEHPLGRRIRTWLADDLQLYDWACRRFDAA